MCGTVVSKGCVCCCCRSCCGSWDLAAGSLLVAEAGGRVSQLSAEGPLLPYAGTTRDIIASNGTALHEALVAELRIAGGAALSDDV